MIYNVRKRCIQLLETGEEDPADPIGHLDFGSAPELLFRPCDVGDEECYIGADGVSFAYDPLIRLPRDEPEQEQQQEQEVQQQQQQPEPAAAGAL